MLKCVDFSVDKPTISGILSTGIFLDFSFCDFACFIEKDSSIFALKWFCEFFKEHLSGDCECSPDKVSYKTNAVFSLHFQVTVFYKFFTSFYNLPPGRTHADNSTAGLMTARFPCAKIQPSTGGTNESDLPPAEEARQKTGFGHVPPSAGDQAHTAALSDGNRKFEAQGFRFQAVRHPLPP